MKNILSGLGILAVIGFFILLYRWITCKNGCPPSGIGAPCMPTECSFWTGKPKGVSNKFPNNPNQGDTFTKDGKVYTYTCIQPNCITATCPPICNWVLASNSPAPMGCNEQYQQAENEWTNSGIACIMTSIEMICPTDNTFKVGVNPCVGKILEGKGWKSPVVNPPANPPSTTSVLPTQLEVINVNGAKMHYQNDLASGGKSYGASNVIIPAGSKFQLIKFWQTNLSTQPLGGFYETNYKNYGPKSGFFDMKDLKQI